MTPFRYRIFRPVLAVLALAAGLLAIALPAAAQDAFTVRLQTIEDRKAVSATVESVDVVPARARIGGTVRDLSVDEGSQTEAGQVIARVDDPKLPLRRATLDARIESLKAQAELAKLDLDRARELRKTGAISQARLDEAETNMSVVTRNLAAMRAERQVVVEELTEGEVLAPAAGRVLKVHVTDGTVIMPGEPVATIARDTYILRMELPERHARFLKVGDKVLVGARGLEVPAPDDAGLTEGRVRQVYPELQDGRVIADVDVSGLGDYFVGERTRVYVSTGERETYVVPPEYLIHRFGLTFVKLKKGGEAVVVPGQPAEGGVEILSGLTDGDVIVRPESG
jgi:RND family efflux transporter MFP subunit